MVSELPWDSKTGTLRRELAAGMMNPACSHALEAALQIKENYGGHITVITMGPPMAEEVLYEAIALGADRGVLLTDKQMAGADTFITSFFLAQAIKKECAGFDLVLCGCYTSDSETAQVGPQLAEELNVPGVAYVEHLEIKRNKIRIQRLTDNFLETLEMNLPGLITVTTQKYAPRYSSLSGLQDAFEKKKIVILNAKKLGLARKMSGQKDSPTKILDVYTPIRDKKNIVLKGTAKKIVGQIFEKFDDKIGGAIGKDLKVEEDS
jgi:electron transfer flavoprotein beta subunit